MVCKRLRRRMRDLEIKDFTAYRDYLVEHPRELESIDSFCWIPISRFYRDRDVFDALKVEIVPALARSAIENKRDTLRILCAGCASGEEVYTLALMWKLALEENLAGLKADILGTDSEPVMLERAEKGCYRPSSLRELPEAWRVTAFEEKGELLCIRDAFRKNMSFEFGDIRRTLPQGPFDLILCRYMAFTYFDEPLQAEIAATLAAHLMPGGYLVIGKHETVPETAGLNQIHPNLPIYRRPLVSPGLEAPRDIGKPLHGAPGLSSSA